MKWFIDWIKSLFAKKVKPVVVPDEKPTPVPGTPVPIKMGHGERCNIPGSDKAKEKVWRISPYSDVRFLQVSNDTFIGDFARNHFRVENDYCVADDFEHSGVIYVFDHFSVSKSSNKTYTNPLKVGDKSTFRIWWQTYHKN